MSQLHWQDYSQGHVGPGILHASGGEVSESRLYSPFYATTPGIMYPYHMPFMMYPAQEQRAPTQDYQSLLRRLEALSLREIQIVQQLKTIDHANGGHVAPEAATEELKKLAYERYQMIARLPASTQPQYVNFVTMVFYQCRACNAGIG
jgi:hypothetical protein